jgi:hypothetical protein
MTSPALTRLAFKASSSWAWAGTEIAATGITIDTERSAANSQPRIVEDLDT